MEMLHIEFELPTLLASDVGLNSENISQEIHQMVALFLYEHKRISLGKACEIGGLSLWEFLALNRQLGIDLHYSIDDLQEDLERLTDV